MTRREGYDLKGKVAIITGGNRGIGYATAMELAERGCNIVIGAKTVVPREKTKETIWMARDWLIEKYGVKVLALKVDVRSDRDVEELVRVTIEEFGRIDILINNAGALIPQKTEELSMKQYDLMMEISVRGAFHLSKPSDLIPELQGRMPIRVELAALTVDDFTAILTEPDAALTTQYEALLQTEGVALAFTEDGIRRIAELAWQVNEATENIGARRLHTLLERLLEVISFEASDRTGERITIDQAYVAEHLDELVEDEDYARYIL